MRYLALACDYDGTLAADGRVTSDSLAALERLSASGRQLVLVTGRILEDLLTVFPHTHLFSRVVAENGAVLYCPSSQEVKPLCPPPPREFVHTLQARGVTPLSTGQAIVATWEPQETIVLSVIRDLGFELQMIFNKGAVMVLPTGVNKATGLAAALDELGLSRHNVVGVGDAENDHAFLQLCECSVAVANALPTLRERVDLVTNADHGGGVVELIDRLLANDLQDLESRLIRHHIPLGTGQDGREVRIRPYGSNILLAGTSGSGKSTLATGFFETLSEQGYQVCVIDPEGDYEALEDAVVLGNHQRPPTVSEILQLLQDPVQNVVVNLLGLALEQRPAYFLSLFAHLQELRGQTGRPHWIVVDEAHHLLPVTWQATSLTLTRALQGLFLITVHPDQVAPAVLALVDAVIVVGGSPEQTLASFSEALGRPASAIAPMTLELGEAVIWQPHSDRPPLRFWSTRSRAERRRHQRKYAEGELGPDKSFYFRGPDGRLNLRAQNLILFLQLADGVDDATWVHHLQRGDYSDWFREAIKDAGLAAEAAHIERLIGLSARDSRARIRAAIEQRYTLPSSVVLPGTTDSPSANP